MVNNLRKGQYTQGFTLVELIVVITILATLGIIGFLAVTGFTESAKNSKRVSDISLLSTAINGDVVKVGYPPMPTANKAFYTLNGGYAHTEADAYGVSSQASNDLVASSLSSNYPLDPQTGSYYGYGRLIGSTGRFELAGVMYDQGNYYSYVKGISSSSNDTLAGLIQAYNSTDFVYKDSTNTLPYNPYSKSLIGQIVTSSGVVTITPTKDLTTFLTVGDTITVSAGGQAEIKFNDGSQIVLGSTTQTSELSISNLQYKDADGLFTLIRLALTQGEVWTKAPTMRSRDDTTSEFEVETRGTTAAVRGTIFGARTTGIGTGDFTLLEGSISLKNSVTSAPIIVGGVSSNSSGVISVARGSNPITATVDGGSSSNTTLTDSETLAQFKEKLDVGVNCIFQLSDTTGCVIGQVVMQSGSIALKTKGAVGVASLSQGLNGFFPDIIGSGSGGIHYFSYTGTTQGTVANLPPLGVSQQLGGSFFKISGNTPAVFISNKNNSYVGYSGINNLFTSTGGHRIEMRVRGASLIRTPISGLNTDIGTLLSIGNGIEVAVRKVAANDQFIELRKDGAVLQSLNISSQVGTNALERIGIKIYPDGKLQLFTTLNTTILEFTGYQSAGTQPSSLPDWSKVVVGARMSGTTANPIASNQWNDFIAGLEVIRLY